MWSTLGAEGEVCVTTRPGEATEAARRFAEAGAERVVAMGGDGTLNEVVAGLLGTGAGLGLVAVGTGNDYARTLGLPTDPVAALAVAAGGPLRPVDVGLARWGDGEERPFVNVAGVGFDAEVTKVFNSRSRVWRALPVRVRYYLAIARTLVGYRPPVAKVTLDGETLDVPGLLLLAAGHARYYGAGMMVLPGADPSDGLMDVVWGAGVGPGEVAGLLTKVDSGAHVDHPKVHTRRCRTLVVETDRPVAFHLEGDVRGVTPLRVETLSGALQVAAPPQ